MDPVARAGVDLVALTRGLVDIDSTTGREGEAGRWLAATCASSGSTSSNSRSTITRFNVIATTRRAPAVVVLSTHFDCVPPFFPSRVERRPLYGRGSCDAKGILAAQVAAADELRRDGETRVGLLFVVGEERGSDGARAANRRGRRIAAISSTASRPTTASASRRAACLRVQAEGVRARRAFVVSRARRIGDRQAARRAHRAARDRVADDPVLGRTHYTRRPDRRRRRAERRLAVGRGRSDVPNRRRRRRRARAPCAALESTVSIEHVLEVPPVQMTTVPGSRRRSFRTPPTFRFCSNWGQPLLFGPGSIHVAHTADEFIEIDELHSAVDGYVRIVRELLDRT